MQHVSDDAAILDDVLQNPQGTGTAEQPAAPPPNPFAARLDELAEEWAQKDKSDPPGDIGGLGATLAADRSAITDLLASDATEQSVGALAARIAAYEVNRRKAADQAAARASRLALNERLKAIPLPIEGDLSGDQTQRLAALTDAVTKLAAVPDAKAIADAEAALKDLPALVAAVGEEIARRKAGEKLKADAALIKDPPEADMDAGQKDRLTKQRSPITSLAAVPDAKAIADAEAALKDLPALVAAVGEEIARRKAAAKVKADAALLSDPAATETDADQKARLLKQRAPIVGLPADPDASQLKDAQDALAGLQPLIVAIEAEIAESKKLAQEKVKVLKDLAKALPPPGAGKTETAELDAMRATVRKDLEPAAPQVRIDQTNIDTAKASLKKLTDRIAALPAMIAARKATEGKIADAQGKLADARNSVPSGLAATLAGQLTAIANDVAKGTKVADFAALDLRVNAFEATVTQAVAFGDRQRRLITLMPISVANGANQGKLQAALTKADAEATKPDLAAANAALDAFEAEPMGTGNAGQADKFLVALKAFRAKPVAGCIGPFKALSAGKFPALEDFKQSLEDIIKAVTRPPFSKTLDVGIADLAALEGRLNAFKPVADAYETMRAMATKGPATAEKNAAKNQATWSPNPVAGKAAIDAAIKAMTDNGVALPVAAPPPDPAKVAYDKKRSSLTQKVNALKTPATAPGATYLDGQFTAAQAPASLAPPNYANAMVLLAAVETLIGNIRDYRAELAAFTLAAATLDPAVATDIFAPVKADADTNKWATALAKMPATVAAARAGAAFRARRAEIALLSAACKDSEQKKTIDAALLAADALAAKPSFKFAEATAELDTLHYTDGVMELEADVTAYCQLLKRAEAQCTKMTKAFTDAAAAPTGRALVEADLVKAKALFDPGGKPADAVKALELVIAAAGEAERAARERQAAVAGKRALDTVPAFASGGPPPATPSEVAQDSLTKALTAASAKAAADMLDADGKLAGGKFAEAQAGYRTYRKTLNAAAKEAAKYLDLQDHGHSIDAHGPAATKPVPDDTDPQVIRVKTGLRPDGAVFPSKFGSTFESEVDWLAARQLGMERVQKAYTDAGRTPADGERASLVIDHGRPIDRCIAGQRGDLAIDDSGELIEGRTASTYEVWTGLTRTNSGFIYVAADGRWKLHFQYPHADGWDNDRKVYTTAVPDFKLA